MPIKYLYIDDEEIESLKPYTRAIKGATNSIEIEIERPSDFDNQITHMMEVLISYDGLILDWRLDDIPPNDGKRVSFRAAALAQELRTRGTEGKIKELPIILWSTNTKLKGSYYEDNSSHDLFDKRYIKEEVIDKADTVREELICIAEAYGKITNIVSSQDLGFSDLLGIDKKEYDLLDIRFTAWLSNHKQRAIHEYARFLLKEVILRPGLLISEELLAARLGIDKDASECWSDLLTKFPDNANYIGPFSEAWKRWWSQVVEKTWWRSFSKIPLSTLSAEKRVDILRKNTGLENIIAAKPIRKGYGDHFQTICELCSRPLDTVDGVIIDEKEPLPWQERKYISIDAALERRGESVGIYPHPMELERLEEIKKG